MTDPYRILGLAPPVDDEVVRRAYLEAIRECPPERDAARFEAIRNAYEAVADSRRRLKHALFNAEGPTPAQVLETLIGPQQNRRPSLASLLKWMEQS